MSDADQTSPEPQKPPKVVKRYANRKLYDTEESRYVTLDEIAEMIRAGVEVKVVDNRNKEDLTSVTLAQIIFEQEKKTSLLPLGVFRDIIRTGGEQLTGYLHSGVEHVGQRVASIREEAEGILREKILNREGQKPAEPVRATGPIDQAKELVQQSQKVLDDWQKRLDERVHQAVENLTSLPALARDVVTLEKRIRELEKRLEELDQQ